MQFFDESLVWLSRGTPQEKKYVVTANIYTRPCRYGMDFKGETKHKANIKNN